MRPLALLWKPGFGRELFTGMISLDMKDYDVILGMDFLAKHGAPINFRRWRVVFQPNHEEEFELFSEPNKKDKVLL